MRKNTTLFNFYCILFLSLQCLFWVPIASAQQPVTTISDYVIFGATKSVKLGASSNIQGGSIGSYKLIQSTGNIICGTSTLKTNLFSGGTVILSNNNEITGKITAANTTLPILSNTSTILSVGTGAKLTGNIDVKGNIVIGSGTVSGIVTNPPGFTYKLGGVTIANTKGNPTLPVLPQMPGITNFPSAGTSSITSTSTKTPGAYDKVNLGGNTTLTLSGPGTYIFNSFTTSGPNTKIIFDFKNTTTGNFLIYVHGKMILNKTSFSIVNGGSATRIYTEIHGACDSDDDDDDDDYSFIMSNGSNGTGNPSGWLGSIWAPYAGIKVGTPNGPSMSAIGALWSGTKVNIGSGVKIIYAPFVFCPPLNANAGQDKALDFTGTTILTGTSSASGALNYNWQASNGGVISSATNTQEITVSAEGTYIFKVTDPSSGCSSTDEVNVTSKLNKITGSELQSIFENKTSDNTFFDIQDGYIKIDIIAISGKRQDVINLLLETPSNPGYFGLKDTIPNGLSGLTITGRFPIDSILKLNNLGSIINYCRPYYKAILFKETSVTDEDDTSRVGLIRSQGDTSMKTHLVRSGYGIYGDGIKIGVMSDSYSSITSGTTATLPLQPVKTSPFIISPNTLDTIGTLNTIPQTFNTNTTTIDISNRDLPADVTVIPAFQVPGTDEGRAMLQIVRDIAPGAALYFRTGFNTAGDFAKGIKELRDAGCDIVVEDITYPTEPFLRDGIVARTVNEVKAGGLTYFSSAGNFGKRSYEKDFTPVNFNGKVAHNFGGGDVFQKIKLAPGDYTFVFQWVDNIYSLSETVGTINDFDFYLTKNTDGSGLVGFNRDNTVGDPIEFIPITIPPGDSVEYNVYIVNNTPNSTTNPRIKYIAFRGNPRIMEFNEGNSTIVGQANAEGAIAVGATRFNHIPGHPLLPNTLSGITKPKIESFSSIGGTWVNGAPRQKPDLVGPDGGNTTVKMGQDYPDWALDGFSNFFGTSAAAPHVAAAAALIMEGRKKFLGATTTTPDQIKALFQGTAVDMETTGFDFISGNGLVDADSAMRTFAAPRPRSIKLVVPVTNPITIPGDAPFLLTVTGENFSTNSEIWYGNNRLVTVYLSPTKDTIQAYIPAFSDNAEIRVYTDPKTTTPNPLDGGFSNSLFFFDADIVVRAVNANIKYGQNIPTLDTIITINGKLLQDTTVTLADIGLANMKLTTTAPAFGFVGTYNITPSFDPADMPGDDLLIKYNYQFINAQLSIAKMPLKVTPNDKTIVYGQPLGNVTYKYEFEPGNQPSNVEDWQTVIKLYHETILPNNALAVIKDFNKVQGDGGTLTNSDLANMNMMITFNALINSGKFIIENNKLVPVSELPTLNGLYLVDVASESIYNYLSHPETATLYSANPAFSPKAVLGASALIANTATVQIPNGGGGLAQMVNGMVSEVAGIATGPVVPIINNNLIQVLNAKIVELVNNEWVPVAANATDSIQIVNNQLTKFVNGVPQVLPDGVIVQVNGGGGLAQLVNGGGGLAQLVNGGGGLAQLVNGVVNSDDLVFQNGQVNVVVNGGGGLAQLVNGTLIAFPNGGGGLAQLVNGGGGLAQLVNGGGGLAQLVNGGGGLAQLVNGGGGLAQLVNGGGGGGLAQLVNGGGGLAQLVNGGGGLAQLVNGNVIGVGAGANNNTAVILDESNINHPKTGNWLGAMFGINMITGLNVGQQKLVSGIFINPNFDITYGLGTVEITKAPVTVTAKPDTKDYDGSKASALVPTIDGLSALDVVVTQPIQTFDTRNAGTGKALTASGLVVNDGNGGDNYTVTYIPAIGEIRKITATVTAQTQSREYNGNITSAVAPVVTGLISPDVIAITPIQTFDTRHAGAGKTLTASGLVINDGNSGGNYLISYVPSLTGEITKKAVTVTAKTDSKIYDGNDNSTAAPVVAGIVSPDAVSTAATQKFDNKNAGINKVLTPAGLVINDGNGGGNYTITNITNSTGTISKKMLTVTAQNKTRYFGENNPELTATYSGFVTNENLANSGITGAPALSTTAVKTSPVGNYPIAAQIGTLAAANYSFGFVNGVLCVTSNPCLITHSPVTNFYSTSNTGKATSLWMSITTKICGQLKVTGDYLLFKSGDVTFTNITSSPTVTNFAIPDGKIIADNTVSSPITSYDATNNLWITKVPLNYNSSSDIFITGAIINSSNGFVKKSNPKSVVKGSFYSNKNISSSWSYGIAAYQPIFAYSSIAGAGQVKSINGSYKAGTPTTQISKLVCGGTGTGGNNYTGTTCSADNFTACSPATTNVYSRSANSSSNTPVAYARDINLSGEIEVSPNPASTYISLSFVPVISGNAKITLFTIDGKKVYEYNNGMSEAGKKYFRRIDVSKLLTGVYIIQISGSDKITNKKIIISR